MFEINNISRKEMNLEKGKVNSRIWLKVAASLVAEATAAAAAVVAVVFVF